MLFNLYFKEDIADSINTLFSVLHYVLLLMA